MWMSDCKLKLLCWLLFEDSELIFTSISISCPLREELWNNVSIAIKEEKEEE